MSPRRTWLDGRIDVFMAETQRLGLVCPREPVGLEIQARVEAVATALRVTEQTARRDFDDETIQNMAQNMAFQLAREQPGADILTLAPTHVLSTALAGRTNAGLAVGAQLALTASPTTNIPDQIHQVVDLVFFWGILIERSAARPGQVAVPEALIHRTVREFGKAIALLDAGARPADGGDPTELRVALTDNVTALESTL
ncbi:MULTISPECIES: hypothetical protein [Nocardia]|uniref:hypothetical protein n=1 Tax=Nocardia TaxID=1817 RepID=UPI001F0A92C9|nr:hypothetical protein [Nocardia mangyaensis]